MTEGIYLQVKVIPKAGKNEVVGWEGEQLKVRVTAVPEKGKANEAVIKLVAKAFDVAPSRIKVVSGETSRLKRLFIEGLTELQK